MSQTVTQKLMLFFPKCECEKPIIYHLVKDHNLIVNVYRGVSCHGIRKRDQAFAVAAG